ncbi:hypothetical protein ABT061_32875 [Streptosporangium sp. NPDC002544]|uniref:hypothetical protein n=1 Tax=Streptosporangium sp. NPDC002544 TaxID=3154538 RepID=UPI00331D94C2
MTVCDRDTHPAARNQGGTLDLHADDGQLALREAGLIEEFFRLARPEGQEMRLLDPTGLILGHHVPAEDELFKPEIDRGQLRDLLLSSLEPGTVQWGRAVEKVSWPAPPRSPTPSPPTKRPCSPVPRTRPGSSKTVPRPCSSDTTAAKSQDSARPSADRSTDTDPYPDTSTVPER